VVALSNANLHTSLKALEARSISLMAAAGFFAVVSSPPSADAASFTYNFKFSNALPVTLTLDTSSSPLTPGTIYDITGVSGSIDGVAISGLDSYLGASQKFKFDPDWILTDSDGISFVDAGGVKWNIFNQLVGFDKASNYVTSGSFLPDTGSINEAGTQAPSAPPSAPGPLPLFGASVAFGMSRQLRRRVKAAS
jgi:hypothetical protein